MITATDPPILDALQQKGVLVSAHVRYWRGRKKLRPEDVGLDPDTINNDLIALGQKRLVAKEALDAFALIEGRAHALVEAASFPFLKMARFVPNDRIGALIMRLDELKIEFEREIERFVANYNQVRADALSQWRQVAQGLVSDPARLVRTIEDAFPIDVRQSFGFGYQLFQISAPKDVRLAAYDAALSSEVLDARRNAADAASRAIKENAEAFVAESVRTLRVETAKLCDDVLATLRGGTVNQKTLNRLDRFVDRFRSLNFVGDAEMERRLKEFRAEFLGTGAADYRDSDSARFGLVQGISRLRNEATILASQDGKEMASRFGEVGRRKFGRAS